MITESPWSNQLHIAIKCWARNRAREMSDKAAKAPNMEQFLAELLQDALLTFNDDYMRVYNEHAARMERMVTDLMNNLNAPPPIFVPKERAQ